jgi:hypothetical protein
MHLVAVNKIEVKHEKENVPIMNLHIVSNPIQKLKKLKCVWGWWPATAYVFIFIFIYLTADLK